MYFVKKNYQLLFLFEAKVVLVICTCRLMFYLSRLNSGRKNTSMQFQQKKTIGKKPQGATVQSNRYESRGNPNESVFSQMIKSINVISKSTSLSSFEKTRDNFVQSIIKVPQGLNDHGTSMSSYQHNRLPSSLISFDETMRQRVKSILPEEKNIVKSILSKTEKQESNDRGASMGPSYQNGHLPSSLPEENNFVKGIL